MLRFMRLDREALAPQTVDAMAGTAPLLDSLNLSNNARSLIATVIADGSRFNFTTGHSGNVTGVFLVDGVPQFAENHSDAAARYNSFLSEIRGALEARYPALHSAPVPGSSQILSAEEFLGLLLKYPQHVVVVDDRYPVIVPAMESGYYSAMLDAARSARAAAAAVPPPPPAAAAVPPQPPAAAAAGAGPAAAAGAAGGLSGCLIAVLIGLLLLLLALGFYFWRFWPWPFEDSTALTPADELTMLEQKLERDEGILSKLNDLADQSAALISLSEEDSRLNSLDAQLARLENDLRVRDELEKLLAQSQELITAAEQPVSKPQPVQPATPDKTASSGKQLPKCETIIRQGKMPQLIIATDGSGSMIKLLNDGTMRITAAIKAANALVDSVDKNVPVRLFGMQGCPLARDYGTFSGSERGRLKNAIAQTNPMNVKGMLPVEVLTPLISGLTGMVNAAPSGVDSVGILISDGVDTCRGTEDMDICAVARKLHKTKPKLKINVILIGEDAPDAKCVADITGGKVYRPGDARKLIADLKNAGKTLQKVCN